MKTYKSTIPKIKLSKIKSNIPKVKIESSKDCYEYVKQFYSDDIDIYESVFMLILNRANNTEGFIKISMGGTSSSVVDVKIIAKYAIETLASSVIIVHNHPSGNLQPSSQDKRLATKIKDSLSLFDINLLDFLIISSESHLSFNDELVL